MHYREIPTDDSSVDGLSNIFVGDAWFGGVKSALAIESLNSLDAGSDRQYCFNMKNNHSLFPKRVIAQLSDGKVAGTHCILHCVHPMTRKNMYAIGYKYNDICSLWRTCFSLS